MTSGLFILLRAKIIRPYIRITASALVFLLIVGLGVASVSWQTMQGLQHDGQQRLEQAVKQIDKMFDNADQAATALQPYLGQSCSRDVVLEMRRQIAIVPNVRTVNLATGDTIYCTALFGPQEGAINDRQYVGGKLYLMTGNAVTPQHPLIAYRQQHGDNSILIGVDGYYMHNILDLLSTRSSLIIRIGDQWMDHQGKVHLGADNLKGTRLRLDSTRYPYQIALLVQHVNHWRYVLDYSPFSLLLFPLLGVFMGLMTYMLLGRVGTPLAILKASVANREFVPYFQPVVDGTHYQLTGCEVLMRWQHPQAGLVPPYQFIPLAEESGMIVEMTRQLMTQTHEYYAPRLSTLPDGFHFGFNICASHFKDLSLIEDCKTFLDAFKGKKINLVLELTERELIEPSDITDSLFKALRRLGVSIALDDFGTGHSSLTYLQKFHIDFLKIDQSFIGRIGTDALSGHIVDNVIDLAKRLDMVIVAEGIETQEQVDYLTPYHLEFFQGYFFGKPVTPEEFSKQWLQSDSPAPITLGKA